MSAGPEGLKERAIYWFAGKLPSCEAITRLASESMERPLSARERVLKRLHYLICVWCERYERQLRAMRDLAREGAPGGETATRLSDDARDRLKRALRGEDQA